ncbi:Bug family tripartite tricarboxylate transporter substrate binding protein [Hydrogenophaga sp. BPS33]|uniref:Bug family tripartite tricarboxylate transporter substrate binding protein n=1 Tax=Hydrogenophaga sp. BPS33 TaxID=2651974 RepID=UPI00131FE282|nr:tripartite tricarboxylate transporter substrate binding protein [Hydrogenophaga sp. BPS33]QHE87094.1 tripartite tricarboxylate transporter substrate binding protein [Hydrogenophaga sp. BPS33]
MQRRHVIQTLAAGALAPGWAWSQAYPARPIRLINPFAAGGALDQLARLLGQHISEQLGQPVVVENKTGASGNIGAEFVARSAPDGYTLVMGSSATHGIAPSMYGPRLPFDALKDFSAVSATVVQKNVLVVNPTVAARNVQELIALARAQPGKLSYGSSGAGTSQHLSGELFKQLAKVDMIHVPYKGSAPAMQDLLGGQLTMMFTDIPTAAPYVRSGKLHALGLTAAQPSPALPDVVPLAQQGLPQFDLKAWYGVLAPAKTPDAIVKRLNASVLAYLSDPGSRDKLLAMGMEPLPLSAEQSSAFIADELKKWTEVVRVTGATI